MCYILLSPADSSLPGGREFIRQLVLWLIAGDLLIPALLILVVLLVCWVLKFIITLKEDRDE